MNKVPLESGEPQLFESPILYIYTVYSGLYRAVNLSSKRSFQGHKGHGNVKVTSQNFDKWDKLYLC